MYKKLTCALLALAISMPASAQDGNGETSVITPPILSQPETEAPALMVPPDEAMPGPAPAPEASPQSAPVVPPAAPPASEAPQAPVPAAEPSPQDTGRAQSNEAFGDWTLECFEPAFETGPCQITHRVISGGSNQVVMVFALSASAEAGPANIQMALPLGIALSPGIGIMVGNGYQSRIPLDRCTPQGCIVEGTGSDEFVAALKREASGVLAVENDQGQEIQLPFSLNGFTAAYTEMLNRVP
jgi:invasion protein IalB